MSMSPEQIGYTFGNEIEIKAPAHSIIFISLDNKEFTNESEYLQYMLTDEYLTNREKMRQNLEITRDEPLLEKFYNEEFKNKYDPEFKDLDVEYKKALSKLTQFVFYKVSIQFRDITQKISNAFLNVKLK